MIIMGQTTVLLLIGICGVAAHVLNYDSVTVCDGMAKQIKCPGKENIHVLQGFYGKWRAHDCHGEAPDPDNYPTCRIPRERATAIAKQLCQGQNTCKLIADKSIFGDPCPRSLPYLYVTFFCMASGQKLNHRRTKFNEEVVTVPSHGFVVKETRHHLEEQIAAENREKQKELQRMKVRPPPGNPTPPNAGNSPPQQLFSKEKDEAEAKLIRGKLHSMLTQEQPRKPNRQEFVEQVSKAALLKNRQLEEKPKAHQVEDTDAQLLEQKPKIHTVDTEAWDRSNVNQALRTDGEGQEMPVFHSDTNILDTNALLDAHLADTTTSDTHQTPAPIPHDDASIVTQSIPPQTDTSATQRDDVTGNTQSIAQDTEGITQAVYHSDSEVAPIKQKEVVNEEDKKREKLSKSIDNASAVQNKTLQTNTTSTDSTFISQDNSTVEPAYLELKNITQALVNDTSIDTPNIQPMHNTEGSGTDPDEVKGLRAMTICNGQSKLIACMPDEQINIHHAFYGKRSGEDCLGPLPYKDEAPTCSALDAKSNVMNSCDGKQTCLLFADDNIYGKSLCPNVNKYLYLRYTCDGPVKEKSPVMMLKPQKRKEENAVSRSIHTPHVPHNETNRLCNGERHVLTCQQDGGLKINSAFYGKKISNDCKGELVYRDDIPECSDPHALDTIRLMCEGKPSCELASENSLFGEDMCPGVNKYLEVTHTC